MNKIGRGNMFLAPESIVVWDFSDTKWLQELVPVESEWDGTAEKLIFGLAGLALAHLVLTNDTLLTEESWEFVHLVLELFGF